jgi:hypothetical protein
VAITLTDDAIAAHATNFADDDDGECRYSSTVYNIGTECDVYGV